MSYLKINITHDAKLYGRILHHIFSASYLKINIAHDAHYKKRPERVKFGIF